MRKRGWTKEQIKEAIDKGESVPEENRINPSNGAARYVHPENGKYVVVDNVTREVIHIGGPGLATDLLTIHVRLLEEGVNVYRPVVAKHLGGSRFLIVSPRTEGEVWEFDSGSIVVGEPQLLKSVGPTIVAMRLAD